MGIFCDINLCKPADGRYTYQPGSIISGAVRYCIDTEYEFSSITVTLKGLGHLYLEDLDEKRRDRMYQYTNDEIYVDLRNVVYTNGEGEPHPVGQYDTQFSFQLPYDIPASIDYKKITASYYVLSYVKYFIGIKFETPRFFRLNKKYRKEINVISGQTPRLTTEPLIYGDQKYLLQLKTLLSSKKGYVNIKAVIANSVLTPGESVKVDYEITNNTNKAIKDVEVKMTEVDQYTSMGGRVIKVHTNVNGTEFRQEGAAGGETTKFSIEIMVPEYCASFDHCNFLSRDYSLVTVVRLPDPHINLPLEIPFQVIKTPSSSFEDNALFTSGELFSDDPPTYWETMAEDTNNAAESNEKKAEKRAEYSEELEDKEKSKILE